MSGRSAAPSCHVQDTASLLKSEAELGQQLTSMARGFHLLREELELALDDNALLSMEAEELKYELTMTKMALLAASAQDLTHSAVGHLGNSTEKIQVVTSGPAILGQAKPWFIPLHSNICPLERCVSTLRAFCQLTMHWGVQHFG
jgi:hypothetical protein